jgi:hypothetical protein
MSRHNEETRRRMSESAKRRCANPDWKPPIIRNGVSEKTREKLRLAAKKRIWKSKFCTKEELLEIAKTCTNQKELAKILGCSPTNMSYLIRRWNIKSEIQKIFGLSEKLTKQNIVDAYTRLGSYRAVSKEFNCSNTTIRNYMRKFDIYQAPYIFPYNHDVFSEDNEVSFYLAGVWAADGNVRKGKSGYQLRLTVMDKEWVSEIANIFNVDKINIVKRGMANILGKNYLCKDLYELSIHSKKLFNDIQRFNVCPNKTLVYKIPDFVLKHPLCNHFLRGMVDGDGSFYERKIGCIGFNITGTYDVCEQFRNVLSETI